MPETGDKENGPRRLLLLFGGFALLGIALALILFGSDLLSDPAEEAVGSAGATGILDQVPQLQPGATVVAERPRSVGLDPGNPAPGFVLRDLEGNEVSLAQFKGQPVILNFWATWCAPCRIEMPELQTAYEEHQDQGLVILAVNREEEATLVSDFFYDEMGLTFTPLLDEEAEVATQYNVFSMPSTYFIDREGIISALHRGPLTAGQIEQYLEAILPEEA